METESNNKCIFNDNSSYMKSLVGKQVAVDTIEKKIYKGTVYVIDPESKTIVLTSKKDPKVHLDFIMYDSIKSLKVTSSTVTQEFLFENIPKPYNSSDELKTKKIKLKEWLELNHIEVREEGELLKLNDQLTIEPPYGSEQCLCNNTIVLDRIKAIIEKMPSS